MQIAPESAAIERARRKLLALSERQQITSDGLAKVKEATRALLANNQSDRKPVPGKVLGLFANNQTPAQESETVQKIRRALCETNGT